MKQADEAIDRVLTGLRESEAPAGLEGRILQAMRARVAMNSVENQPWWTWPRLAGCGALLAGLLVLVAVSVPHRVHRVAPEPVVARHVEPAPAVIAEKAAAVGQARVPPRVTKPLLVRVEAASGRKGAPDSNSAEDALAREEMLAPSHPAPPLPMTAQEKLFRQAVIEEHFDQLAMLNPEEREKANTKADDEFGNFFGTRKPSKQEEPVVRDGPKQKSVELKQDGNAPLAAPGASQASTGRR